jgi:hypothetical protein
MNHLSTSILFVVGYYIIYVCYYDKFDCDLKRYILKKSINVLIRYIQN